MNTQHRFGLLPEQQEIRELFAKFYTELEPRLKATSGNNTAIMLQSACDEAVRNVRKPIDQVDENLPDNVKKYLKAGYRPTTVQMVPDGEGVLYNVAWTNDIVTSLDEDEFRLLQAQTTEEN